MLYALPARPACHAALAPISAPSPVIKPLMSIGRVIQRLFVGKPGLYPSKVGVHAVAIFQHWIPQLGWLFFAKRPMT